MTQKQTPVRVRRRSSLPVNKLPLIALSIVLAAGSATAQSSNNGTTSTPKDRPVIGMTKARAAAYYGEPFTKGIIENGERWYYRLKFNEVYGRALVPFYYDSPNVRWGSIDFGPEGRVRAFDWRAPRLQ